ncbi:MAG TPA: enoyl-CoA hydratase-related protein [Roseiarcus sp.]|nr:enoyl-CoA hydratase-related protein [Roseiarcus sp.]
MDNEVLVDKARRLYVALADGDRAALDDLLHANFVGRLAEGMPFGVGGTHEGPQAMRRDGWGAIARHFEARAEPEQFIALSEDQLLVTGRYRGEGKRGGAALDAEFAHLLVFEGERIRALTQYTDTGRWRDAASRLSAVTLEIAQGVATLRLDRPRNANAIDPDMASDLLEAATQIAETPGIRAVLIAGSGAHFSVGGDIAVFVKQPRAELPKLLRRMIDSYHLAIERLTAIDAPVVAAVRGAVGGGAMGLLYAADIVVAADDARFALGYGALGLTCDGGSTYFLPRLIGLRRTQELFLLNRRLTAPEALEYGLVSRLAPSDKVEQEAAEIAVKLAAGPTRAYGGIRSLLKRSLSSEMSAQLAAEKESLVAASESDDAREGIAAFIEKRPARFQGK